ncbi:unnamed protein product [Protopolystoma xenopodis]|uniref:Uncharacterized protein n=1 Tax=Protopolystoma xenopodis TaxID=117903 RepID=A0A3S4ZUT1_9PLAT|nr:unnamed protein product [Protopolystoma xenopodis]
MLHSQKEQRKVAFQQMVVPQHRLVRVGGRRGLGGFSDEQLQTAFALRPSTWHGNRLLCAVVMAWLRCDQRAHLVCGLYRFLSQWDSHNENFADGSEIMVEF